MKINVIGLGYIGLPTAAIFAASGAEVVGVDQNESIVATINSGNIHIEEPGLHDVIKTVVDNKKLTASLTPCEADAFIIAVPTPNKDDEFLSCDLAYVLAAVHSVMPYLCRGNVVVIESTVAPRTTEDYIKPIIEQAGFEVGKDIYLAHCPERVLPGKILHELVNNNRVVGGITAECAQSAADLYRIFVHGEIIKTEAKTAELSKLMENTFRDVNIALANELAEICCSLNINVHEVIKIANKHPRVNIHSPGPGVGGHCLAVDPYFIYAAAPEKTRLIKLARDINSRMPDFVVANVEKLLRYDRSLPIAAMGVTYKPDVDDIRESPALKIVDKLKSLGYHIRIHDPHVANSQYCGYEEALKGAGMLLCLVGHNEFKSSVDRRIKSLMARPLVFDVTGTLQPNAIEVVNYGNLHEALTDGGEDKLVSIIIPTYNRAATLKRAVDSCLTQTYANIEVIVVDDNAPNSDARCSTEAIMCGYEYEPRVRYILRDKNGGGALARNTGIFEARGHFITFLDDDDEYLSNKVEEQVREMGKGYDMIFSDIEIYHENTGFRQLQTYQRDFSLDYKGLLTKHLVDVISGTPTFMYTRKALWSIGGFDDIPANQEYVLMLKTIVKRLNIGYLNKALCRAYTDDNEVRISNGDKIIKAKIDVIQRVRPYLKDIDRVDSRKAMFRLNAFVFYQSMKRRKFAALWYGIKLLAYIDMLIKHKRRRSSEGEVLYK